MFNNHSSPPGERQIGLIGGVEKRDIVIVRYDPTWPLQFERHAAVIGAAVGQHMLLLEHIGSTAVPELPAKPIVDILLVVQDSSDEETYLPNLVSAGYELRVREPDFDEHRMFRTPAKDVHLHVYSAGSREIERYLAFRDRLRDSRDDRQLYARTKMALAAEEWPDMNAYAEAKTRVIEDILKRSSRVGVSDSNG